MQSPEQATRNTPPHTYRVPTLEESVISRLTAALALARSMVLSGEKMSDQAGSIIDAALAASKAYRSRDSRKGEQNG